MPDLVRSDRARDRYFWDGADPEPALQPGVARRLKLSKLDKPLAKGDTVFSEAEYLQFIGSSGAARLNAYNPFGRFSENLNKTAFLPFLGVSVPKSLGLQGEHMEIAEWDPDDEQDIEMRRDEIAAGIPRRVKTKDGSVLSAVAVVPPWGIMYGDGPPLSVGLVPPTAPRPHKPQGVPLNVKQALDTLQTSVEAVKIDKSVLDGYRGKRKEETGQITVMGVSAGDVASAAGYGEAVDPDFLHETGTRKRGWEWLHLVAYGLGGPTASGPQTPSNLVVGTTAANTAMIMVEDAIAAVIHEGLADAARVTVLAVLADERFRIAETIHYDVAFAVNGRTVPVEGLGFSALSVTVPFASANRYFRQFLRQHLEEQRAQQEEETQMMSY